LGRPLPEVLEQTGVSKELKDALLKHEGLAGGIFQVTLDVEQGRFDEASARGAQLGINDELLALGYTDAVAWADQVMRTW
jgi:EAL and modified HD-GYP domain-containing signal transduction protein